MMTTDDLFVAACKIGRSAPELADLLRRIYASEDYSAWRGTLAERVPFRPADKGEYAALEAAGLGRDGSLAVKINMMETRIFITDGVWTRPENRVFPFCDESATLLTQVRARKLDEWADVVVDLATGCGHNIIAMKGGASKAGFDINPRAIVYAVMNRALNVQDGRDLVFCSNDIRDGIPKLFDPGVGTKVLFVANMPFAPAPPRSEVPVTTNGGKSGIDLQLATFTAIRRFAQETGAQVRAVILGITAGNAADGVWDLASEAQTHLGGDAAWNILSDEKIFRINGVRQIEIPSPVVPALRRFGSCRLYYDADRVDTMSQQFGEVGAELLRSGRPDLAYGVVDARL